MNEKLLHSDSETLKHINEVRKNIWQMIMELDKRAQGHDQSKLESPEREIFADNVDQLGKVQYGTDEYKEMMDKVRPAIEHHYADSRNRHHPEHFSSGMNEMDLLDIVEMLADWLAATKRNRNGNIHKSIEINAKKYEIPEMLANILSNTINRYF